MKFLFVSVLITILFFFLACKKKEESGYNDPQSIEESVPDDWLESEEQSPVVNYEFDASEDYHIKVEMHPELGWVQYSVNDPGVCHGLNLPIHLQADAGYCSFEMEARDVNNDGYQDLVLSNIRRSKKIERIYYFDPDKALLLSPPFEDYCYHGRSLKNLQGFVSLNMDDQNFVPDDSITLLDKDNIPWLRFRAGDLQNLVLPHILNLESSTSEMYTNWLYMRPWLILFEVYHKVIFRCESVDEDYYTVVVNEQKHTVKRLKKSRLLKFETLEEHLTQMLITPEKDALIFSEPDENSSIVTIEDKILEPDNENTDLLRCAEIKGDWMRLMIGDISIGWIRWKKGDTMIVDISYLL